ncbi:hypothetical protein SK069_05665 [Patulibacter brassicae]|uniref:Uncharacterized protein n=1 Tax=Patulibacter brassicae TaxID=1705717 RepID=A0ABU4VGZ3_9ACTN|nr:hypothetical protein [Patulibacter brassicae]MDX8151071.1 hypothetical protein [Patulibacter brassicae]
MSPIDYRVGDRVEGEVLGFRQWRVSPMLELRSASGSDVWTPGTNTARCRELARHAQYRADLDEQGRDPSAARALLALLVEEGPAEHPCPAPAGVDCDCGLYALHEPEWWYGEGGRWGGFVSLSSDDPDYVSGLVVGWGAVEVHHEGWRAEYARVAAIAVPSTVAARRTAVLARAVAADYGVPTVPQDDLQRIAGEFGRPVPEEHRPERPQRRLEYGILNSPGVGGFALSSRTGSLSPIMQMRQAIDAQATAAIKARAAVALLGRSIDVEKPEEPTKAAGPEVPAPVAKARRARPRYDPRHFVSKRKGGHR